MKTTKLKRFGMVILIGTYLGLIVSNGIILGGMAQALAEMRNKTAIYENYQLQELKILMDTIIQVGTITLDNDKSQVDLIKIIEGNITELRDKLTVYKSKLSEFKTIDMKDIKSVLEANVDIYNITVGISGSGTHIKINGESYLLTCAHLIRDDKDFFVADTYKIKLIKSDKKRDLALFKFNSEPDIAYLELSDIQPPTGSEVFVVGNPAQLEDIVTEGIVAMTGGGYLILTNKIFYGNSGGAVLYKGLIIGVIIQIRHYCPFGSFGIAVDLNTIQEFLAEI